MNDWIEIGVFEGGPPIETDLNLRFDQHGDVLHLERHRSGRQTILITVPRMPVRAGIDPYGMLIDRRGHDNVIVVQSRVAITRRAARLMAALRPLAGPAASSPRLRPAVMPPQRQST
jgi:hypothetical protein